MKKTLAWLLTVCVLLTGLTFPAIADLSFDFSAAQAANEKTRMVSQNEALSCYLDGNGNLMITGHEAAVNKLAADEIISIDAYHIVFTSRDASTDTKKLVALDLGSMTEQVIADSVHAACVVDETKLYYIRSDSRANLVLYDFETGTEKTVYSSFEYLDGLYDSIDGLVITFVENAGSVIYLEASDSFESYGKNIPVASVKGDDYEIYLASGSLLYHYQRESVSADLIDSNVYAFTVLDGVVYYIANTGSAVRIKSYDPVRLEQRVIATPEETLEQQITASEKQLFVLGSDHTVYSVSLTDGTLTAVYSIPADSSAAYTIEAMHGALNVYAVSSTPASGNTSPEFTFLAFSSDAQVSSGTTSLVTSIPLEGEDKAWDYLEPAVQYAPLARGSRGPAVSAIQDPLFSHGYYDYYIDGIFGYRTENAVLLLQGDLGRSATGIADSELQTIILSGNFPKYDPFAQVNFGDRGLRVKRLQQRLRDLGYLSDKADGIYGRRTRAAVRLFQYENGLSVKDNATRETMLRLFSRGVPFCTSFIDLYNRDTGCRVRSLNQRLKDLFYLDGNVNDVYSAATAEAIRRFQAQVGLPIDGIASVLVQRRLFAPGAPECSGYIELRRGNENIRVQRLQRRLKELNYFNGPVTGYFGRETQAAVKLFQSCTGMRQSGIATIPLQELLFSPYAPIYVRPTYIGKPMISIAAFEKRENGIFYFNDTSSLSGAQSFSWYTDGEVTGYNVKISDMSGKVYLDQATNMSITSFPIASLKLNTVYTITVTAYPADGRASHVTSSSLSFCRTDVPKPEEKKVGRITEVYASIGQYTREDNSIFYVQPASLVSFNWYAEGDLSSYHIEIRDQNNKICISSDTTDEATSIKTDAMDPSATYTLMVYAIPTNGTLDDSVRKTLRFAIDNQLPKVPEVEAPVITVDNVEKDASGKYIVKEDTTVRWNAVANAAQYYIEVINSNNVFCESYTTSETSYLLSSSSLTQGYDYTVTVTAIPTGGTIADGKSSSVTVTVPHEETITTLDAPNVTIIGLPADSNGIVHIASGTTTIVLEWSAVNGADQYNVVVRDAGNSILKQETQVATTLSLDLASVKPDDIVSVGVTAISTTNAETQGTEAVAQFMLDAEEEVEAAFAYIEEPMNTSVINPPQISINDVPASSEGVNYVDEGMIRFSWDEQPDVAAYDVSIRDALGNTSGSTRTNDLSISVSSDGMVAEEVYTLQVAALPMDGSDPVISETAFSKHAPQTAESVETALPEPTIPPEVTEAPAETELPEITQAPDMLPEETPFAEETPAADQPEATEEPALPAIMVPVLSIEPLANVDADTGINYVSDNGNITMHWDNGQNGITYHAEILQDGSLLAKLDTPETTATVPSAQLTAGVVYALQVTATDGNVASDVAELKFALYQEGAQALPPEAEQPEATEGPVPTEGPAPAEQPEVQKASGSAPVIHIEPLLYQDGDVSHISEGNVLISWETDWATAGFHVEILLDDSVYANADTADSARELSAPSTYFTPGTIYEVRVYAETAPGDVTNAIISSAYFILDSAGPGSTEVPVEAPTEQPFEPEPTEEPYLPEETATPDVPQETAAPDVPQETVAPEYNEVSVPQISIEPVIYEQDGISYVPEGELHLSWYSEGQVENYHLEILYGQNLIVETDSTEGSTALATNGMQQGAIYTFRVTAIPAQPSQYGAQSAERQFALYMEPVTEEPTPSPVPVPVDETEPETVTPEPTEIPTPEPTEVPTPEPTEIPTPEPTEVPTPEPTDVPTPEPTEIPTPEPTEVPTPEPTEVPTPEPTEIPTPEPTEVPTPEPTEVPTPEPTEIPTPEPTEIPTPEPTMEPIPASDLWSVPVTPESDPATIMALQTRLEEMMLLEAGTYTPGMLDSATINAVLSFQYSYNSYSEQQLPLIDAMAPVVDTATLAAMMSIATYF